MLVRELMEQLAEMPPELPVVVATLDGACIETCGASRGGRLTGPVAVLTLDADDMQDYLDVYVDEHIPRDD
jgi:hypothetical protein